MVVKRLKGVFDDEENDTKGEELFNLYNLRCTHNSRYFSSFR